MEHDKVKNKINLNFFPLINVQIPLKVWVRLNETK